MIRFCMILMAIFAFATFDMPIEAQRGGRGGGRGGASKYKGKGKGSGSKGISPEEIAKLKEKYPDTWEDELKKLQDKYKKYSGKKRDVKADTIPLWKQQRVTTWAEACDKDWPLVLAFVPKKDELNTKYFVHKKAADESRASVSFVWLLEGQKQIIAKKNKDADRIKGFGEKEDEGEVSEEVKKRRERDGAIIARSNLIASDLWKAYDVTKGNCFIVCDKYGNELKRFKTKPSGTTILSTLKKVKKMIEAIEKNAEEMTVKFLEAKKKNDMKMMLKHAVAGIDGKVGLEKVEILNEHLEEILVDQDDALEEAIEEKNVKALEKLAKTYEGTRIAKSANATIEAIAAAKAKAEEDAKKAKAAGK